MTHGTGLDLWRGVDPKEGIPRLYEARYLKDGKWHGFEWWLNHEDQRSLCQESHFWNDRMHGIQRSWLSGWQAAPGLSEILDSRSARHEEAIPSRVR